MCTLSIFQKNGTTRITMNRDEQLSRAPETPPHKWDCGIWAPKDTQSNGTWIGLNPNTKQWACLLNGYAESDQTRKDITKSRGAIIPEILIKNGYENLDNPNNFASFRLIQGDQKSIKETYWNGETLQRFQTDPDQNWLFRSSSSWEQTRVINERTKTFQSWLNAPTFLEHTDIPTFHAQCQNGDEASSILMQRDNPARATVSITNIEITNENTSMHYFSSQTPNAQSLCALTRESINNDHEQTITSA